MEKKLFRIITASNLVSLVDQVNTALKGGYVLHGDVFQGDGQYCQALIEKSISGITIDSCKNSGAITVSGTITVNE